MLITFSGLDGAGKSTLIEWLRASLEREGHCVTVLHMNDDVGVYACVRGVRDRLWRLLGREVRQPLPAAAGPPGPAAPGVRGRLRRAARRVRNAVVWSETVRGFIYPIDLLVFALYRIAVERLTKRVFIMDRYFYDTLVDLTENGHRGWSRWLRRFTRTPDVPVLLDVPPERAFGRKGEHSVGRLERRWAAYQTVMSWVPSCVKLPNEELAAAQATLWRVVTARMPGPPGKRTHWLPGLDRADERQL